ncbi:MAG: translation initiation factor IF-2 [Lentimicrobiaceae bacterium]|nr:translation initiation factor IF-2 [Lentimicrobiaceae bacterium]
MSEEVKIPRLGKAAKEFNVATATIVEFLSKKGFSVEDSINTKLTEDIYRLLMVEYQHEKDVKEEAQRIKIRTSIKSADGSKSKGEKADKSKREAMPNQEQTQRKEQKIELPPVAIPVKPIEKTPEKPIIEKIIEKPVESPLEKKIEKVSEKKTEKVPEKKTEKISEKKTEKVPEKKTEKISEKKTEKTPEKKTEAVPEKTTEAVPEKIETTESSQPPQEIEAVEDKTSSKTKAKIIGKVDLDSLNEKMRPAKKTKAQRKKEILEEKIKKEKEILAAKAKREKQILAAKTELSAEEEKERRERKRIKDRERKRAKRARQWAEKERQKAAEEAAAAEKQAQKEKIASLLAPPPKKEAPPKKEPEMIKMKIPDLKVPKVLGVVDLSSINERTKPRKKTKEQLLKEQDERIRAEQALRKARQEARKKAYRKEKHKDNKLKDKDRDRDKDKDKDRNKNREKEQEKNRKPEKGNNFIATKVEKLSGVKVVDKITLPDGKQSTRPQAGAGQDVKREKRQRFKTVISENKFSGNNQQKGFGNKDKPYKKDSERRIEISGEEVDLQIKKTMARMAPTGKTKASKHRKEKRDLIHQNIEQAQERLAQEKNILKVTEFITANELANMMNVSVNKVISTCMSVGLMVAINQRLDTENIQLLAEEFGFQVQFVGIEEEENKQEEEVNPADLEPRAPIVTIMGHVDHGKTSLLDYIRKTNVIAGEAGGITQHIGAYEVELPDKRRITFLDTPGHEAFTAMRARGAKVTDIVIVVIAADDSIMPQTVEAINHAQAAGVPIIFAINKIDKPGADPEKIRNALANMNLLVEEWGGKIQSQDISAKKGINVDVLMEKILIEAEMLELKANPKLHASGTILESSLDKGRGYVAKALIQSGTLYKGDVVAAGTSCGKIKAMYNERNHLLNSAGPASPVLLLGLDSAPQAGDTFKVYENEKEAKSIVSKRQQLIREQGLRTQKHITLTEIGRRIAIGDFKELNIIVKGDVDGSIEALSDALLRLTTEEIQVNVIHKSVGQVTESDILLASASNAIIIAFQVRPSAGAKKLAEQEQVDVRTYSIIYDAINDLKEAIEGMKAPEIKESIVCNIEVREVFHISKVGVIAGCYVLDGKVQRSTQVRVIRDGIVIHTGRLGSLKRFKDDVKEVTANYECGLNIESFNDVKIGDIIEGFEQVEVKR